MPDRIAKDLARAKTTVAVLGQVGPMDDIPAARQTVYQQKIANVQGKQTASNSAESAKTIKHALNVKLFRELWVKLVNFYAVAMVTAPDGARGALRDISTDGAFSRTSCLRRAQQTLGVLTHFPDDYAAAGLTKAALETLIIDALAADTEEQSLISADHIADGELKTADRELHEENKAIYKMLKANFSKGSPQRKAIDAIPTTAHAAAAAPAPNTPTPDTTNTK